MEITSPNNALVKDYVKLQQKKYRNETGKFLLEGFKAIKEAFDCGIVIEKIFVDSEHIKDYNFAADCVIETNSIVLKKLCTTDSPPTAIAVGFQKQYETKKFKNYKKVILLENIKDVGNLGTIIRSAVAFGCQGVVLYGDCADLYNPKCVRSAVGNLWKIPVVHIEQFSQLKELFEDFSKIATLPRSKNYLKTFKPEKQVLIMFGSEAEGLSKLLIDYSNESIKIEMNENVESLNLASSVSIIMYELFM